MRYPTLVFCVIQFEAHIHKPYITVFMKAKWPRGLALGRIHTKHPLRPAKSGKLCVKVA
jgi:hypothetical protein